MSPSRCGANDRSRPLSDQERNLGRLGIELIDAFTDALLPERRIVVWEPSPAREFAVLRILIADDHEVVRNATRRLIEEYSEWTVCAEARDGQQALDLATRVQPDIAIVDVSLPTLNGVTLTERLIQDAPHTQVLLFTMHEDDDTVHRGLAAGERGYVVKTDGGRQLQEAVAALRENRVYFSSSVFEMLLLALNCSEPSGQRFTRRERRWRS